MDRDIALHAVRERFETLVWSLLEQLEQTLGDFNKVKHVDPTDLRAVGSALNAALASAADAIGLHNHGLEVVYCRNGQSNKLSGAIEFADGDHNVSFELHLSGPRGGTSKSAHQFAGNDIEQEPSFPGFEIEAPPDLLFFVACHLAPTGMSIARAFLKFADGVDQRKIEIHRSIKDSGAVSVAGGPVDGLIGSKLIKKQTGEQEQNGSKTAKRGDAASSSKKT